MADRIKEELIGNFNEFIDSAEEDLKMKRFNPAVSSYTQRHKLLDNLVFS